MTASSSLLTGLAEAALRSLLVAAVVGCGLAMFRTRNVMAQKSAWMLVLGAAILMPALTPWATHATWVPSQAILRIPRLAWPVRHAAPVAAHVRVNTIAVTPTLQQQPIARATAPAADIASETANASGGTRFPAPAISHVSSDTAHVPPGHAPKPEVFSISAAELALLLYGLVAAVLLGRVAWGAWAATGLWLDAEPVVFDQSSAWRGLKLRASRGLASPVTVGSGIVLPDGYTEWDPEKLRIVLAHEASHVRQCDFYLQIGASLYTALFWFSPLGWWLKRKLSDLSETISDGAAVEQAASHASYAQVLLEFAALPHPLPTGVAMARQGRLVSRIERLLNESSFRQAFAGGGARIAAAVLLVPAALFAATALVRVQAAQQTPAQQSTGQNPVPAQPADERTGVAAPPEADAILASPQAPEAAPAPPAKGMAVIPKGAAEPPLPPSPDDNDGVTFGAGNKVIVIPPGKVLQPMMPMMLQNARNMVEQAQLVALAQNGGRMARRGRAFAYGFGDGESYAYVTGSGDKGIHYSGNWYNDSHEEIDRARKVAHGDFLWFERDGKSYVVDDPATLAALKPMQDRMEALGQQQEELGRQQEELGRKQEELGRQQEEASVPTPDVSKELADLNAAISKLNAQKGGTVTAEQLGEIQSRLGDLQGKLGSIEGKIGEKQGELGAKQGELGEQQGKLGAQQGRLGAEQGRIAREMDGKVLTMIDESLKNGKARLVQ